MPAVEKRSERGQGSVYTYSVVLALITVVLAALLVNRVAWTADSINKKAKTIEKVGGNIQGDVVIVKDLDTTNALAGSILQTAQPLDEKLTRIVDLAKSVDGTAKSINGSAGTISQTATAINGTAGTVDGTAKGINGELAGILDTARSIDRGTVQINANLDATIGIVTAIKNDGDNILRQAVTAHKEAACIDKSLPGGGDDGHCR